MVTQNNTECPYWDEKTVSNTNSNSSSSSARRTNTCSGETRAEWNPDVVFCSISFILDMVYFVYSHVHSAFLIQSWPSRMLPLGCFSALSSWAWSKQPLFKPVASPNTKTPKYILWHIEIQSQFNCIYIQNCFVRISTCRPTVFVLTSGEKSLRNSSVNTCS